MADGPMIRKQLYITREQERALKERARKEGLAEAEIVREALARHLQYSPDPIIREHRRKAVEDLIAMSEKVSRRHRLPEGYSFSREELYDKREERWSRRRE